MVKYFYLRTEIWPVSLFQFNSISIICSIYSIWNVMCFNYTEGNHHHSIRESLEQYKIKLPWKIVLLSYFLIGRIDIIHSIHNSIKIY